MSEVTNDSRTFISGILLAGGEARRMGYVNKGFQTLRGKTMVAHILERLNPQVSTVAVSANQYARDYQTLHLPVYEDDRKGFLGPLAGIETVLKKAVRTPWAFVCPIDTPFLPHDLVCRLYQAACEKGADCAIAVHDGKEEPLHCLLRASLLPALSGFLDTGGRSVIKFLESQNVLKVPLKADNLDFTNLNTADELARLNKSALS